MESGGGKEEAVRALTSSEEAIRKNTDCVYFLASPLTCKKGSECEYRHSEAARVNPTECWYWMNGSCSNPKCSFRHPSLDGQFGFPTAASVPSQIPAYGAAYNMSKQSVPCYYFQKGICIKGDRCQFSHGLQSAANNNSSEQVARVSAIPSEQPQNQRNDLSVSENFKQKNTAPAQQTAPALKPKLMFDMQTVNAGKPGANLMMPTEVVPLEVLPVSNFVNAKTLPNGMVLMKKGLPTSDEDQPGYFQNDLCIDRDGMQDWNKNYQGPPLEDRPQNSREADEFVGESSPGFDVLVDNSDGDAGYLHNEEDFGGDMYPMNDCEYATVDNDLLSFHEREYNGLVDLDQIRPAYDGYERKRRRASSERHMERSPFAERRHLHRETELVEMDRSDLRYRLQKQRRLNGSRLAVSPDRRGEWHQRSDRYGEQRRGGYRVHREHLQAPCGSSISSRLQGRIKLPDRSPAMIDRHADRDRDGRRLRDRSSPSMPMDFRQQERLGQKSSEIVASVRTIGNRLSKRGDDVQSINFSGPKRLAELKGAKVDESTKSDKEPKVQESEASLDFEGPMPLSVILKRKRESSSGNGVLSNNISSAVSEGQSVPPEVVRKNGNDNLRSSEERKGGEEQKEEGQIPAEGNKAQSLSQADMPGNEDGIEVEDQEESEHYDTREGKSDYEVIGDGEYKSDDEYAFQDDDEFDDDDDDFARKVGVMFT